MYFAFMLNIILSFDYKTFSNGLKHAVPSKKMHRLGCIFRFNSNHFNYCYLFFPDRADSDADRQG
ncbi:MAG: hypothetical protein B7Y72_01180, partial [Mehylophilales bacterium 35-46-6]